MVKRAGFPKIYFGWWTVLSGGILALWAAGFGSYGFSALFKPISSELGFSRATTSVAASISRFEGGFEAPLSGWITDRFGPKWMVVFGVFLTGLSLVLMYSVDSLWAFYLLWGLMLGTGQNIATGVPIDAAISNWFVKKRGVALSSKMVFSGLSGVVILPLVAWLIVTQGWRMTCFIGGVVMWVIGLPLAWLFFKRHRPEYYGLLPDGVVVSEGMSEASQVIDQGIKYAAEAKETEFTLRQAMGTPSYWLLVLANAMQGAVWPVLSIHCIPFLTDIGIDPLKAAGMMSIYVGVSVPFRVVTGFVADRLKLEHLRFLLAGAFILQVLGFAAFLLNRTIPMIYVWFVLYGIGFGLGFAMSPIRGRYFGRKAFGSIQGTSMLFGMPFGVLGPVYAGWVYDTTGSYLPAFFVVTVLIAASAVVAILIPLPKAPAQTSDIREIL